MDSPLKIGFIVGVFVIAFVLYRHSQNGRYQFAACGNDAVIVDTRTGEFWTEDGTHFESKSAHITTRHPWIDDQTANDDSVNKFRDCLHDAVTQGRSAKDCVTEKYGRRPEGAQPSPDASK